MMPRKQADIGTIVVPCLIGSLSAEGTLLYPYVFYQLRFIAVVFLLRADAIWAHQRALRASLIAVFLVRRHDVSVKIATLTENTGYKYNLLLFSH